MTNFILYSYVSLHKVQFRPISCPYCFGQTHRPISFEDFFVFFFKQIKIRINPYKCTVVCI